MGFSQLILVNLNTCQDKEACWLTHGATDILEQVLQVECLQTLRLEFALLTGSTAPERVQPRQYLKSEELKVRLTDHQGGKVGLVFGREASGLTNDELQLYDL